MKESDIDEIVLVDGSGYIFRAYYALPMMTRSDGLPVNAIFGFCNMLLKLLEDIQRDRGGGICVAVIFDAARKTFRNDIYKDYKANRSDPPEDLVPQFDIIKTIPELFNIPSIQSLGFEADDLIASYSKKAIDEQIKVTIVSSDKDLMQLLKYKITLFDPIKRKDIGLKDVIEKFGVDPTKVIDVQALAGDQSDNIPGIPGIGVKTASLLINEFNNLENLLEKCSIIPQAKRREKIESNKELAIISKKLVTLREDVELPISLEKLKFKPLDVNKLISFLDDMEFSRIKSQVLSKFGNPDQVKIIESSKDLTSTGKKIQIDLNLKKDEQSQNYEIDQSKYVLVNKEDQLNTWIDKIYETGVVAIDCETTSLSAKEANIVGFSMSLDESNACYIPISHKNETGLLDDQINLNTFIKIIKPLMEDESVLKIGQNIKYDLIVLNGLDINTKNFDDTMLMSYVLNSGKHSHKLDDLSKLYLNHETVKFSSVISKEKKTFDYVDIDTAAKYAAEDADITFRLWKIFKDQLLKNKQYSFYFYMEKPLIAIILKMELNGIKINIEKLKKLTAEFEEKILKIENVIFEKVGEKFNVGSPKQLGEILFEKMKLPNGKRGKSGNYQTDVGVLEKLKNENITIANDILDWRQFNKLKTTYCEGLITRGNIETSRVHTSFGLASTTTGRLSSNDPNLQNIPIKTDEGKKIRSSFISKDDYKLVSIDYSQIELRILAHVAKIENLIKGFRNNNDIHSLTAMEVFQVNESELTSELRRRAKTINFGIIYGISPYGLANQLNISNSEAKEYINKYFRKYPGIENYMSSTIKYCKDNGFVSTLFGRKIFIPFINDKNAARRNFGERSAINAPIQGGAADMIKRSMIQIDRYISSNNLKTKMLLQVHDELIFEVPKSEIDSVPEKIASIMEICFRPVLNLSVPLKAEIGNGYSWAEAH